MILHVAVFPFEAVAVTVTTPRFTALTRARVLVPVTVATAGSEEDQVTDLSDAFSGPTVTVSSSYFPSSRVRPVFERVTD